MMTMEDISVNGMIVNLVVLPINWVVWPIIVGYVL